MKAIKSCMLSYGLISVPVKIYGSTTEADKVKLNELSIEGHKLKRLRFDENKTMDIKSAFALDGSNLEYADELEADGYRLFKEEKEVIKGYNIGTTRQPNFVEFNKEELNLIDLAQNIEIIGFVEGKVNPLYFEKWYDLQAIEGNEYNLWLFRELLKHKGVVAIGRVAFRTKERICLILPMNNKINLVTLRYSYEVRLSPETDIKLFKVNKAVKTQIDSINLPIEQEFNIAQYKDNYKEKFEKIVKQKIKNPHFKIVKPELPKLKQQGNILELMAKGGKK